MKNPLRYVVASFIETGKTGIYVAILFYGGIAAITWGMRELPYVGGPLSWMWLGMWLIMAACAMHKSKSNEGGPQSGPS